MKETEILKIDSRGRIVIPRGIRRSLGLKENSQIMIISDTEENEARIIPLSFANNQAFMKIKIILDDQPGALSKAANVFGKMNISLIYGQTVIIKKGKEAEWTVISPVPDIPVESFKKRILEEGGAKRVLIEKPFKGRI